LVFLYNQAGCLQKTHPLGYGGAGFMLAPGSGVGSGASIIAEREKQVTDEHNQIIGQV